MTRPVPAVGGALAGDHRSRPVLGDLDVVHRAGVHPHDVDDVEVRGVGHVPDVGVAARAVRPGHRVVAPVGSLPHPEIGRGAVADPTVPDQLDRPPRAALADADEGRGGHRAGPGHDGVGAGKIGDEAPVLRDQARRRAAAGHRVGDRRHAEGDRDVVERPSFGVGHQGRQARHVAGPDGRPVRRQRDAGRRVRRHVERHLGRRPPGRRRDRHRARHAEGEHAAAGRPLVGRRLPDRRRNRSVRGLPFDLDVVREGSVVIERRGLEGHLRAGIEGPRSVQRDRCRRPREDGKRHALLQVAGRVRVPHRRIARTARHTHQHGVLARTDGRDATVGRHREDVEAPGAFLQVPVLPIEGEIQKLGLDLVPVAVEHGGPDAGGLAGRHRDLLGRDGQRRRRRPDRFGLGLRERTRGNEQDGGHRRKSERPGKGHLCLPLWSWW